MSLSEIVDAKYRLKVADLQGQEREWVVANISYQGLEAMSPVLHIEGMTKRFVLDQEQSRRMMTLTRSALPEEWIGAKIRVAPVITADSGKIVITTAELAQPTSRWTVASRTRSWMERFLFGSTLLFGLAALAILVALSGQTQ